MYLSKGRGSNELRNLGCYPIRDESLFARREIPGLGRPDDGLMIWAGSDIRAQGVKHIRREFLNLKIFVLPRTLTLSRLMPIHEPDREYRPQDQPPNTAHNVLTAPQ